MNIANENVGHGELFIDVAGLHIPFDEEMSKINKCIVEGDEQHEEVMHGPAGQTSKSTALMILRS